MHIINGSTELIAFRSNSLFKKISGSLFHSRVGTRFNVVFASHEIKPAAAEMSCLPCWSYLNAIFENILTEDLFGDQNTKIHAIKCNNCSEFTKNTPLKIVNNYNCKHSKNVRGKESTFFVCTVLSSFHSYNIQCDIAVEKNIYLFPVLLL